MVATQSFRTVLVASVLAIVGALPAVASAQVLGTPLTPSEVSPLALPAAPAPTVVTPPPPSSSSWTGLYVGGLFGNAFAKADATTTVSLANDYFADSSAAAVNGVGIQELKPQKIMFGGEAGFNGQAGNLVMGVEGDYSVMKLDDSISKTVVYPDFAPTTFTVTQSVHTTWLVTFRGRIGAAVGPALIFGTAGLAMTNLDYESAFTDTFAPQTESGGVNVTQKTLVWGGGVEFKAGPHVSLKGEFLRADFGTISTTSNNMHDSFGDNFTGTTFTHSTTFVLNAVRFGLNVGF